MRLQKIVLGATLLVLLVAGSAAYLTRFSPQESQPTLAIAPPPPEATSAQVHEFCGACHAYPPPDSFPRSSWRKEVRQGYDFFRESKVRKDFPPLESVALY